MLATVWVNGLALMSDDAVLEKLGLRPGQAISEEQGWLVMEANAQLFVDDMEARRSAGEPNIPDTSGLQEKLNSIYRGRQ